MTTRTVYRSSNGDDWLLATDDTEASIVIHRANLSSGGKETILPLEEFLERSGGSPEAQAVRAALSETSTGIESDVDETSAGGLEYPDDPDQRTD